MKLKDPPRLIIHEHGASFSVRVKRGRRWRWEHFCTQIEWTDYQRLLESEQLRLRWLEKKTGCTFVVPDTGYVD